MTTTMYVLQSVIYSCLGIIVGFIVGFIVRGHINGKWKSDLVGEPRKPNTMQVVGVIITVVAVVTTVLVTAQAFRYNSASQCIAAYTESYTEALKGRDDVTVKTRADAREYARSQRAMWDVFLSNAPADAGTQPTPAQRDVYIQAIRRYNDANSQYLIALDAADKARLVYPIPINSCPKPAQQSVGLPVYEWIK